jgi:malonate-semialdehyde dehydrogenase (acetylating)/methylmalonate-semialdehyde dehydrogenase
MSAIGHFIGGKHVAGASGRSGPVFNPATGEQSGTVAYASAAEIDEVVRVATAAQAGWAATPPLMRARTMFKLKDLLERHRDEIARLITLEHGKTHEDA